MRFRREVDARTVLRAGLLAAFVVSGREGAFAAPKVDALSPRPEFNELTTYRAGQINNPDFSGFTANLLAPFEITNLLPQNSVSSIAVERNSLFGLVRISAFDDQRKLRESGRFHGDVVASGLLF